MDERTRQDFAEFVASMSAELLRLAYVLTADQHAAEDLLQSALTKAAARWGRIHGAPEGYTRAQAEEIAAQLQSGPLPVDFRVSAISTSAP